MQTEKRPAATVSQMVRSDYRIADVFKKWGINYCCGGNLSLEDVCAVKNIDVTALQTDLEAATKTVSLPNAVRFNEWPSLFLIDYVVHVHHGYLRQMLPSLTQTLASFVSGHVKRYPYLGGVEETFQTLSRYLQDQLIAEEESLFPYLKHIVIAYERQEAYGPLLARTFRKPLAETVSKERTRIHNLLLRLRQQTDGYRFVPEACTTHQVIYHKLKEFDDDLTQHGHIENNVLFPKVLVMEKALLNS